jgi:hypothetical protein
MSTIEDRPTPVSVQEVQVHLGFANFYRRFVQKDAKVTAPISNLLTTQGSRKWEWTWEAEVAFRKLHKAFTEPPILQHFNPQKPVILNTDASGVAIPGILNQYDRFGILCPANF